MITEEARLLRNEYQRKWRAKNPKKIKASNDNYWVRKAEAVKEEK